MNLPEIRVISQNFDHCLNPANGEDFGVTPEWEPSSTQIRVLRGIDQAPGDAPVAHFLINTGCFLPTLENIPAANQ